MAGIKVKTISRAELCALLPENIEILQSVKPNARWPLYIKTPWGSWFFNSANAQKRLQMLAQWSAPMSNVASLETINIQPPANDGGTIAPAIESPQKIDDRDEIKKDPVLSNLFKLLKGDENE